MISSRCYSSFSRCVGTKLSTLEDLEDLDLDSCSSISNFETAIVLLDYLASCIILFY